MTTTLLGDFALICEVKDKELLNRLLEKAWNLLVIKENSFLIGFKREYFSEIYKFNKGYPNDRYQYFWEAYLDYDGKPKKYFVEFLEGNEDFDCLVRENFHTHTRNKEHKIKKMNEMNKEIELLQEKGDCYIRCSCNKQIKLPSGYKIETYLDCPSCKHIIAIHGGDDLSKVVILKQKKESKKKRGFWK